MVANIIRKHPSTIINQDISLTIINHHYPYIGMENPIKWKMDNQPINPIQNGLMILTIMKKMEKSHALYPALPPFSAAAIHVPTDSHVRPAGHLHHRCLHRPDPKLE